MEIVLLIVTVLFNVLITLDIWVTLNHSSLLRKQNDKLNEQNDSLSSLVLRLCRDAEQMNKYRK